MKDAHLLLLVLHVEDLVDVIAHAIDLGTPLIDDLGRDDAVRYLLVGALQDLLEDLTIVLTDERDRFAC